MKRLLASAIVSAGLLASGAASATVFNDSTFPKALGYENDTNVDKTISGLTSGNFTLIQGAYDFALSLAFTYSPQANIGNQVATLTTDLYKGNTLIKSLSVVNPGTPAQTSTDFFITHLDSGIYHFVNSFTVPTTGLTFSHSASGVATITAAVPGPIAGAGLPALLGLLGFVGFRRGKKAQVA